MTQEMRLLSVEQLRFVSDTAYEAGVRASEDELRRLFTVNAQLLDALEGMLVVWGDDPSYGFNTANKARAAIAAAKGEA